MSSTRAIPAQRLLSSLAGQWGLVFLYPNLFTEGEHKVIEPVMVFSPAMFLPAIIAKASALAAFTLGSADVLGVQRQVNDMSVLGVDADVEPIDGSPEGILRALLLSQATEQVFEQALRRAPDDSVNGLAAGQYFVDLSAVTMYYRADGAPIVRGEQADFLSAQLLDHQTQTQ